MHILPLNTVRNFNKNSVNNVSFGNAAAIPLGVIFNEGRNTLHFSDRYQEIKKFNPDKKSQIALRRLDDEDYEIVRKTVVKNSKREEALLKKNSRLSFSKSTDSFNGITDKKLGLSFSNGYGFESITNTSNDHGDLHVLRETSGVNGRYETKFTDKSRFNENYFVENSYSEIMENPGNLKTTKSREISIRDEKTKLILDYAYSKKYFQNSNCSEFNVNGRKYGVKIDDDGKVVVRSGSKWEAFDFSKALKLLAETPNEKESFMEALKMLPPQMFPDLGDTLAPFVKDAKERKEAVLPYFADTIANIPEQNRKEFANVLKTIMPHMLYDLSNTISNLTGNKEHDEEVYSAFSKKMWNVPEKKRKVFIESLKSLSPAMRSELRNTIKDIKIEKTKTMFLFTPVAAANSMIDLTIERLCAKSGLTGDKYNDGDEQLKEIFQEEKARFIEWLKQDSDGHLKKDEKSYIKEHLRPEEEIAEVIKAVSSLLWMEEYDANRADDEGKRLLLNFFPETVSCIVSAFELNGARPAAR